MSPKLVSLIAAGLLLAACRNNSTMKRGEQNYDVVQEGQTDSVTSTISGPGETPPPMTTAPMTGTNADTTTSFTLPATASVTTNGSTIQQPLPTIAGTMSSEPRTSTVPPRVRIETRPRTTITNTSAVATDTVTVPAPNQSTQPPPDQQQQQPPPPPPTDTTDTTHPPI
jgi:hypothetical protein